MIDKQYLKTLNDRVEQAVLELGRSTNETQLKERLKYRDKKIKEKAEYVKRFTESLQPFAMFELEVLGYIRVPYKETD